MHIIVIPDQVISRHFVTNILFQLYRRRFLVSKSILYFETGSITEGSKQQYAQWFVYVPVYHNLMQLIYFYLFPFPPFTFSIDSIASSKDFPELFMFQSSRILPSRKAAPESNTLEKPRLRRNLRRVIAFSNKPQWYPAEARPPPGGGRRQELSLCP